MLFLLTGRQTTRSSFLPDVQKELKIVPGTVTFQDRDAMSKMSNVSPVGTLAYIIEEEALLVRVKNGWQYIAVSVSRRDCVHVTYKFLVILNVTFNLLIQRHLGYFHGFTVSCFTF